MMAIGADCGVVFHQFFAVRTLFTQGDFIGFMNGYHLTSMSGQKAPAFRFNMLDYNSFLGIDSGHDYFRMIRAFGKINILEFVPRMEIVIAPDKEMAEYHQMAIGGGNRHPEMGRGFGFTHKPFDMFIGRYTLFQRPADFIGGREKPAPELIEKIAAFTPCSFKLLKHADFYIKSIKMSIGI